MTMAMLAKFQLYKIQLCYSIVILVLVSIGVLRIVKQAVDKSHGKKSHDNMIDAVVDSQKAVKAINIAQNPTRDGEKLGKMILKTLGGVESKMKKIKQFYDKFKGIAMSIALGILTAIEMYGGYIGELLNGKFCINGVELVPFITLACAVVIGILSDGWTKEQKEKIKALFAKSTTDELVKAEIKKTLKENEAKLKEFNKILATRQLELDNLNAELETKKNTLSAKREMSVMTPRLATEADVHLAEIAVNEVTTKIQAKKKEIAEVETSVKNLTTTIEALKSQL